MPIDRIVQGPILERIIFVAPITKFLAMANVINGSAEILTIFIFVWLLSIFLLSSSQLLKNSFSLEMRLIGKPNRFYYLVNLLIVQNIQNIGNDTNRYHRKSKNQSRCIAKFSVQESQFKKLLNPVLIAVSRTWWTIYFLRILLLMCFFNSMCSVIVTNVFFSTFMIWKVTSF